MHSHYVDDIKFNCDVSDAKYWGSFSICGLLMRYRELYRSEKGLKLWAPIPGDEIAAWIEQKETRWPDLEKREFRRIAVGDDLFDPFAVFEINGALAPQGLLYGAGYGMYNKPTFFLAKRGPVSEITDHPVYRAERELARDLFSAPGMLQGRCIFLRSEPLKALLYDKFLSLTGTVCSPLSDAFSAYGLSAGQSIDETFERRFEDMTASYTDVLMHHEIAEAMEDSPGWTGLIASAEDRAVEQYLRAVKDLVADTSDRGPLKRIIEQQDRGALGLSVALLEGFRKQLFPELRSAYDDLTRTGDWQVIERTRAEGYASFTKLRRSIIELRSENADDKAFARSLWTMVRALVPRPR